MNDLVKKVLTVLLCVVLTVAGCSRPSAEKRLTVAVTILPQKAFVEAVCGDTVNIVTVVPKGANPENYEPTAAQMESIARATVFFTIGVPFEKAKVMPQATNTKTIDLAVEVAKAFPDREFAPGERDPHIWLSPKRASVMVEAIAQTMMEMDPQNAKRYRNNADNFIGELKALELELKVMFNSLQGGKFIVYHPAFGYLAEDFGLEMHCIELEGKEATASHIKQLVDMARQNNIKTLFSSDETDSSMPRSFAEEIGGKVVILSPLSDNYIENLRSMVQAIANSIIESKEDGN